MRKKLKLWWLKVNCPRFYEDMPKAQKVGTWQVGSIVGSRWYSREADCETFVGSLQDAYIRARELAYKRDAQTPFHDDIGVNWFVRLVTSQESKKLEAA